MEQFFWPTFGVAMIFASILIFIWADHLRAKRKIALREIIQKERVAAMEKGIPLPEWDPELLDDNGVAKKRSTEVNIQWIKLVSLGLGLVLVSAGIGMLLAFELSDDAGLHVLTSIGALPIMTGLGMILFSILIRRAEVSDGDSGN